MPSVLKVITIFSVRCLYNMARPSYRRNQKDQKDHLSGKKKKRTKNANISAENIIHIFLGFIPDSASPVA